MQDDAINKLIADEKELTRQGIVLDFVKTKVDTLDRKFDSLVDRIDTKYVTREEFLIYKKTAKEDLLPLIENIEKINSNIRWVVLLIIGAVITAVLGLILVK